MTNKNQFNIAKQHSNEESDKTVLLPSLNSGSNDKTQLEQAPSHKTEIHNDQHNTVLTPSNSQTEIKNPAKGSLLKNRFDLLEVIGSGGMGTVYKSLDRRDIEAGNSAFIAIKVINDEFKNDSDLLKALHSEARKTQALAHPNIVTVYDFDRDEDTVFMTMEFIDGVPLDRVINANPKGMSPDKALTIISKMSQALIYAHSKNIIHLDFKPNNVFVDRQSHVKVFDFGIARLANFALSREFDASVLGGLTPSYASLEMFKNETPDPRDDLYALACISYELLSGQHPFNKVSADIAFKKQLKPKKIKSLNSKQWSALKQALSFERKDRTKDVISFLQGMTSTAGISPYVMLSAAFISIVTTAIALNFSQLELSISIFPDKKNATLMDNDNIRTDQQSHSQTPALNNKQATEVIKETGRIKVWTEKNNYQIGEKLKFSFSLDKAMYIKIVTINSQGKLIALFPNPYQTKSYCEANITYQIPPKNSEFTLDIDGPIGQDRIIAIGSSNPIPDQALIFNSNGEILDPKLRQSFIHQSISYTIN